MAKTRLAKSARGEFQRDLGWEFDGHRFKSHRFRVGTDAREAMIRIVRLEQIWEAVEGRWRQTQARSKPARPVWDATTLLIANAARKGEQRVTIHPLHEMPDWAWAVEFQELVKDFPMMQIVPPSPEAVEHGKRWWENHAKRSASQFQPVLEKLRNSGHRLHQALDDYAEWIPTKYQTLESDGTRHTSDWGQSQLANVKRLKERHADIPLSMLTLVKCEEMLEFWAQRPPKKNSSTAIAIATAENHILQLKMFFKWLHKRRDQYGWAKPSDLADIRVRVLETEAERTSQNSPIQVDTYSVEELTTLYQHATPLERLYMLLALNCGFGQEAISALRRNLCWLEKAHPCRHLMLGFSSTDKDSFIFSNRSKTKVYGEWKLWPQTVAGLKWQLQRATGDRLFTRHDGRSLTAQTACGKRGKAIANAWYRLVARAQKSDPALQSLSFNKLRKTAGNMIRHIAGGEIHGIFTCHGTPVESDDLADLYSNRPFGKQHKAIENAYERYKPIFKAVADPFGGARKDFRGNPGLPVLTAHRIVEMRKEGVPINEVAKQLGVSRMTVLRKSRKSR